MSETTPPVVIRPAEPGDARFVWAVNNHPTVRAQSLQTADIPWETHVRWYEARLAREDCVFLIALQGDAPAGVARFDVADGEAVISLAVAADHRGRGVGKRLIEALTALALQRADVQLVVAHTRQTNLASQRAFLANGFVQTGIETMGGVPMCRFERRSVPAESPPRPPSA